jgi:hypothetical protein
LLPTTLAGPFGPGDRRDILAEILLQEGDTNFMLEITGRCSMAELPDIVSETFDFGRPKSTPVRA